jgi:hypothetical protein
MNSYHQSGDSGNAIEVPIFRFSYVLSAVLAQTCSIPRKTIRIVHETY